MQEVEVKENQEVLEFPVTKPIQEIIEIMKNDFKCPITGKKMADPYLTCDGYSYEKAAIVEHLRNSDLSPVTNLKLDNKNIKPNILAKRIITIFHQSTIPSCLKMQAQRVQLQKQAEMKRAHLQQLMDHFDDLDDPVKKAAIMQKQEKQYKQLVDDGEIAKAALELELASLYPRLSVFIQADANIVAKLSSVLPQHPKIQIEASIKNDAIYRQISQELVESLPKISLTQGNYGITFNTKDTVNWQNLADSQLWKNVDYFEVQNYQFNSQTLETFFNSLASFQNLKLLTFIQTSIDDQLWAFIVSNLHRFPHIQGLRIRQNQIEVVKQADLETLSNIAAFRLLEFDQSNSTEESKKVLTKFSQSNPNFTLKLANTE